MPLLQKGVQDDENVRSRSGIEPLRSSRRARASGHNKAVSILWRDDQEGRNKVQALWIGFDCAAVRTIRRAATARQFTLRP